MNKKIKEPLIFISAFFSIVFLLVFLIGGFVAGASRSDAGRECHYDNIAKILNPAYFVGCQLFKHREW